MNGHSAPSSYLDRLEAFRKTDADRDALVAEVIRNYEELQHKYAEKCDDYNNEVQSRRLWQGKAAEYKQVSVSSFVAHLLTPKQQGLFGM